MYLSLQLTYFMNDITYRRIKEQTKISSTKEMCSFVHTFDLPTICYTRVISKRYIDMQRDINLYK